MANKKRLATTVGAMALTAVLAIGGTLAYLSHVTETKKNSFTSDKGLTGHIEEENWKYDEDGWKDYTPGESTGKDPVVSMDDKGENAYVGMKIVCTDADGKEISFADFQKDYATVSYKGNVGINGTDWAQYKDTDFYVYNKVVNAGTKTNPIFDTVTINTGIVRTYKAESATQTIITYDVDEDGVEIPGTRKESKGSVITSEESKVFIENADGTLTEVTDDTKLPSFNIDVTGYAIQETGNKDVYTDELAKLAGVYK